MPVYSPKYAVYTLLAAGFVVLAMSRLPLAIAAFTVTVLTFPAHLPGSLGAWGPRWRSQSVRSSFSLGSRRADPSETLPLLPQAQPLLFSVIVRAARALASILWALIGANAYRVERLLLNAALLLVTFSAACTRAGFRTIVRGYLVASVVTLVYGLASGQYIALGRLAGLRLPTTTSRAELIPAIVIAAFLFATTALHSARAGSSRL